MKRQEVELIQIQTYKIYECSKLKYRELQYLIRIEPKTSKVRGRVKPHVELMSQEIRRTSFLQPPIRNLKQNLDLLPNNSIQQKGLCKYKSFKLRETRFLLTLLAKNGDVFITLSFV
ncbi:Hypothetical_protein [Hexamita inflata]|uniref:Hypothetical_protein n=1 Tax=Hexamita inflata TaxID=28002 RepID=A0ABP1GVQ2_9EUKA